MDKRKEKEGKENRRPIREFKVRLSSDGKYFLFSDSTVWIVSRNYISTIDKQGPFAKDSGIPSPIESDNQEVGEGNDRSN